MGARSGWLAAEVQGAAAVAEQFLGRAQAAQLALVDGVPGAVWVHNGRPRVAFVFAVDDGTITAIKLLADPEHLGRLRNYGSLFLGEESTVAYSDKTIGTNHILPTGRAARYTGGLWVGKFIKTVTYQRLSRDASRRVAPVVARICEIEGMLAHKATADLRARRYADGAPGSV